MSLILLEIYHPTSRPPPPVPNVFSGLRGDASPALPRSIARGGRDAARAAAVAGLGGVAGGLALRVAAWGSPRVTQGYPT